MNNFEIALDAREKGAVAIPCFPGTKQPKIRWKQYQTEMPSIEEQREWFRDACNIAILTTGRVVFDCDDPAKVELVLENCGDTPHKLRSPSGGLHLGYKKRKGVVVTNQVRIRGMPIDIRTDGGLTLIPNSETEEGRYEWLGPGLLPASELPVARVGWTRERSRKKFESTITPEVAAPGTLLYRGQRYVDAFERRAVAGSNGHGALWEAALKICSFVKRLGGGENDARALVHYFNATKADPPWDLTIREEEAAVEHKLTEAWKKAR